MTDIFKGNKRTPFVKQRNERELGPLFESLFKSFRFNNNISIFVYKLKHFSYIDWIHLH